MDEPKPTTNEAPRPPDPAMLSAEFYAPWRMQQRREHGERCARRVEQEAVQKRRSRSERRRQVFRSLLATLSDLGAS